MFVLESKNCVVAQTNPTRYNYYYRWAELLSNAILKLGSSGIKTICTYLSPLAFPTQSWDVCCLLQVARTEGQYCMEEVEEAKLNFSFFKSRQNASKSL